MAETEPTALERILAEAQEEVDALREHNPVLREPLERLHLLIGDARRCIQHATAPLAAVPAAPEAHDSSRSACQQEIFERICFPQGKLHGFGAFEHQIPEIEQTIHQGLLYPREFSRPQLVAYAMLLHQHGQVPFDEIVQKTGYKPSTIMQNLSSMKKKISFAGRILTFSPTSARHGFPATVRLDSLEMHSHPIDNEAVAAMVDDHIKRIWDNEGGTPTLPDDTRPHMYVSPVVRAGLATITERRLANHIFVRWTDILEAIRAVAPTFHYNLRDLAWHFDLLLSYDGRPSMQLALSDKTNALHFKA